MPSNVAAALKSGDLATWPCFLASWRRLGVAGNVFSSPSGNDYCLNPRNAVKMSAPECATICPDITLNAGIMIRRITNPTPIFTGIPTK